MKRITQQRLIDAIAKINRASDANPEMERQSQIIRALSHRGLSSALGAPGNQLDSDKLRIEMNFWAGPRTMEESDNLWASFTAKIDYYHKKREKVWSLQRKHQITGLTWFPSSFDFSFSYPWLNEDLNLLESDLEVLSSWKPQLIEKWIDCVLINNLSIHRYKEENWHPCSVSELLASAVFYQWGHEWKHDGLCLFLLLGNGLDTESRKADTIWFCAVEQGKKPIL